MPTETLELEGTWEEIIARSAELNNERHYQGLGLNIENWAVQND